MQEVDNVLRILKETRIALDSSDANKIKILSDQTIHTATIYQDPDNIIVAVLVYSISKILQRENYQTMAGWDLFYRKLKENLEKSIEYLEKKQVTKFRRRMGEIRNSVNEIDSELRTYIQSVFLKAELNKALKIYEHGLSAEQTADLLGVSLWELSAYIGQSAIQESHEIGFPVKQRIKFVNDFFSK